VVGLKEKRHLEYLQLALEEAKKCTPVPTAFCVGCVIVVHPEEIESNDKDRTSDTKDEDSDAPKPDGIILSTGYSRELPGNTHAEANALHKAKHLPPPPALSKNFVTSAPIPPAADIDNDKKNKIRAEYLTSYPVEPTLPISALLRTADVYTTLEPCSVRTSGLAPCSKALVEAGIKRCFIGTAEPPDFVQCEGAKQLMDTGIEVSWLKGLEDECLKVARGDFGS
jgi:pyrimidine deaminase RibD-like protein